MQDAPSGPQRLDRVPTHKTNRRKSMSASHDNTKSPEPVADVRPTRRSFLRAGAAAGAAVVSAPYIGNAAAAETTVWKVQTSWPAGVGLQTFKTWCGTVKEKTGGELEIKPFAAKEVVGDFELLDGVKNGVLEGMNSFTLVLGRQAAGHGVPVVLSHGTPLPARVGHLFLQQGWPAGGARHLRQAGVVLRQSHPPRARTSSIRKSRSARSRISRT